MSFGSRITALLLVQFVMVLPSFAQDAKNAAEPITLANVKKVGLLSEVKHDARRVELGPNRNELLLYPGDGVLVVDDENLKLLREIDESQTQGYAFSQDRSLTSWMQGTTVTIRNMDSGESIEIDAGQRPGKAVFSPGNNVVAIGDMIITGSEGEGYSLLRVFDAKSGDLIRQLEISMEGYGSLSPVFSPDGKTLAVGNRNYQTKLFDAETWNLRHTLPKRMTHEIAFSPDGKTLAAGYVDGSLALWDVESGKELQIVDSGCSEIYSIAWNEAGDVLATAGCAGGKHGPNNSWIRRPGKVLLWNAKTLDVAQELMDVQWARSVRFLSNDTRLISIVAKKETLDDSPRIAIWSTSAPPIAETPETKADVPTVPVQRVLSLPPVAAPTVAVSPDGERVVAPLSNIDQVAMWNLTTGEQEFVFKGQHAWQIWQVAFSPDGSTVATASLDKTAKLWDAKTGGLLATLEGHADRLNYVTYSHAGKYLLTSTGKQWPYSPPGNVSARVWDAKTGEFISELKTHADTIRSATFSEDEARVLTSSEDHTARLWEVVSGRELQAFDLGSGIQSIEFSPDGATILTSSNGGRSHYVHDDHERPAPTVQLWDGATGRLLADISHPQAVTASFNHSGDQVLTACRGFISYWDAASGKKLTTLRVPLIGTNVVFCPNGRFFIVLTPDEPLEVWSVSQQRQIARLVIDNPYESFFSQDGRAFYSLTRAGEFRAWSMDGME